MSKRKRVVIPPLQINPVEQESIKRLMGRMLAPVDSHQANAPAIHHEPMVDSHQREQTHIHQSDLADIQPEPMVAIHRESPMDSHPGEAVDMRPAAVDSNISTRTVRVDSNISTSRLVDSHQSRVVDSRKQDRHKTGRAGLFMRPDPEVLKQVRHYCADADISIQEFYDLAAIHLMQSVDSHQKNGVDINISHDDLKISKTSEDIIMLYKKLTGNKWNPANDRAAVAFNDVDRRILEYAMIETWIRAKGKRINSFAYFAGQIQDEIEDTREAGLTDETIDIRLRRRRQQLEQMKGK